MASKEVDWRPKPGVCGNACPRSPRGPNGPDPCCEVRGRTSSEYDMCKVCLGGYVVYTIPYLYLSQVYKKKSQNGTSLHWESGGKKSNLSSLPVQVASQTALPDEEDDL